MKIEMTISEAEKMLSSYLAGYRPCVGGDILVTIEVPSSTVPLDPSIVPDTIYAAMVQANCKDAAIKLYRTLRPGVGLVDAKNAVERMHEIWKSQLGI